MIWIAAKNRLKICSSAFLPSGKMRAAGGGEPGQDSAKDCSTYKADAHWQMLDIFNCNPVNGESQHSQKE